MDKAMKIVTVNMDEMRDLMATMSTRVTSHIDEMENGIGMLSVDVATTYDNIKQMAVDVNSMSRSVFGLSHDTRRMQDQMDDMMPSQTR